VSQALGILHGEFLNSAQDTERPEMFAFPFFRGRTIAEAVYRLLLIEKGSHARRILAGFRVEKLAVRQDFLRRLRFHLPSCIPPIFHMHQFIYHRCYVILANDNVFSVIRLRICFHSHYLSQYERRALKSFDRIFCETDGHDSEGQKG
jgi:hypothetical protein